MLLVHIQFSCCHQFVARHEGWLLGKLIESLEPVTWESFILLKFSQNYIPIFHILSAHILREISLSLYTNVTGGS